MVEKQKEAEIGISYLIVILLLLSCIGHGDALVFTFVQHEIYTAVTVYIVKT